MTEQYNLEDPRFALNGVSPNKSGEVSIETNLYTQEQLDEALEHQKQSLTKRIKELEDEVEYLQDELAGEDL